VGGATELQGPGARRAPALALTSRVKGMLDFGAVRAIARQELTVNVRGRWTLVFAFVFGALALAISYFGLVTAGSVEFQGFARTSVSLLNLVLYVVPLVALVTGTLSFTSGKTAGELLFSQPVSRAEILAGKILGLFASLATATLFGFGLAGLVIASRAGAEDLARYTIFVALALLLALVFLNLSALVAALCRRQSKAFVVALFLWFFFVLFYDLAAVGVAFLLKERAANTFIFASLFGNPVGIVRVAGLIALDGTEVFGAAGAALMKFLGGGTASVLALAAAASFWTLAPFILALWALRRQDI
jgi:Cu-processing system permease protein